MERKKAKKEQLDHLYNADYQPANYMKALQYKNYRSYKKKLPDGSYVYLLLYYRDKYKLYKMLMS